jgi:hypothetical protein
MRLGSENQGRKASTGVAARCKGSLRRGPYRSQVLPQLDLSLSYRRPGQSGVKDIYLNNDPLTRTVIGEIKGDRVQSLEDIFKRNYNNWTVGLNLLEWTLSIGFLH